jgi:hypothetical protein
MEQDALRALLLSTAAGLSTMLGALIVFLQKGKMNGCYPPRWALRQGL